MDEDLLRRRLPHIDDRQAVQVPGRNLAARPQTQVLLHQRRPSGGGHPRPPLCRRPAAVPADLPAVRRAARAGATAGADWRAVTGPTDCPLVSSWAGGNAGLLLGGGGDDGHSTPASCGAHAQSCWAACSRLTTSSSLSSPASPIMGAVALGVKSGM